MPRQEGLRPIGESVKKIIEKIKKEREERQKKSSSPRVQPRLPGMKTGGGVDMGDPKKPVGIPKGKDAEVMIHDMMPSTSGERPLAAPRRKGKDRIEKLKADLKKKPMKKMATGGMPEDDSEFSRRRKQGPNRGGLTGGQKKLDANKDGKISGDDFKILRGKQNKMKGGGIAIKGTNFKGVF